MVLMETCWKKRSSDIFSTQSFCQMPGLFGFVFKRQFPNKWLFCSRNALLISTHELLLAAGCIYKARETRRCPNIYSINTLHNQVGHRAGNVGTVPLQGEGLRDGCGTDTGLVRKSPWAIASHRGRELRGSGSCWSQGLDSGNWEDAAGSKKKWHQSLANPQGSALGMEGDTVLCWHSPQAASGTDWFGFNYYYSSLGSCCTIYSGLGKTHAPSLEGKTAILLF